MSVFHAITSIHNNMGEYNSPFLFTGKGGAVLFNAYLYEYSEDERHYDQVLALLTECFDEIGHFPSENYCLNTLAGLGWLLQHLNNRQIIELDASHKELLDTIDGVITASIQEDIDNRNYDLFYGLCGKGIYFLERLQEKREHEATLGNIVDAILSLGERNKQGLFWRDKNTLDKHPSLSGVNFGYSHGMPSIIAFFCNVYKEGIKIPEIKKALSDATSYLLAAENNNRESCFSHLEGINNTSRLAWCYGDLGVALCLLQTSEVLQNPSLKDKAIQIAKLSAKRDKHNALLEYHEPTGITETGICHGTAGLAYIYNRLYNSTQETIFKDRANYWFQILLEDLEKTPLALLVADEQSKDIDDLSEKTYPEWMTNNHCLLTGTTGIGLVLLSTIHSNSEWDKTLLLNGV